MEYKTFAALIYVTSTEHDAVMRMYEWQEVRIDGDNQLYYRADITTPSGEKHTMIAARQSEMGMTASATLTMKLILQWRPMYVIMPGIAAGVGDSRNDDQMFGDVILASAVWNCSNGKYISAKNADIRFGEIGFLPRPTVVQTDEGIIPYLRRAIESSDNECYVHFGYLASGSAVMANRNMILSHTKAFSDSTEGLEMEGYGVAYAAREATEPRPIAIIAKSICDFGDERKDDTYQKFAAYTSCEFVALLCDKYLPNDISNIGIIQKGV